MKGKKRFKRAIKKLPSESQEVVKMIHEANIKTIKETFNDLKSFRVLGKHIESCPHPSCVIIREILDTEETPSDKVLEELKSRKESGVYVGNLAIKLKKI